MSVKSFLTENYEGARQWLRNADESPIRTYFGVAVLPVSLLYLMFYFISVVIFSTQYSLWSIVSCLLVSWGCLWTLPYVLIPQGSGNRTPLLFQRRLKVPYIAVLFAIGWVLLGVSPLFLDMPLPLYVGILMGFTYTLLLFLTVLELFLAIVIYAAVRGRVPPIVHDDEILEPADEMS